MVHWGLKSCFFICGAPVMAVALYINKMWYSMSWELELCQVLPPLRFFPANYERRETVATTDGLCDMDTHLVCLYEYLTQMANKIASQLGILTANFLAREKVKCTLRVESSTHQSQKMLSSQYHLAQNRDYFAVLSHAVHKCEVNQHISISLWFSDCLYSFSKLISGRGIIWSFAVGLLMTSLFLNCCSWVNKRKSKCTLHSIDCILHLACVQEDISLRLLKISASFWSIGRV